MEERKNLRLSVIGAGRIGEVHAKNISQNPLATVASIFDVDKPRAAMLATQVGAKIADTLDEALSNKNCDGVVICSATNTHADLIEQAAKQDIAIFCEKPIDLAIERVDACAKNIQNSKSPIQLGFNRRFDPSHASLREAIRQNEIGCIQHIVITSRDPYPPPTEYIYVSGGIFRDMSIHDFDMACFLSGERPISVFASGECRISKNIAAAGDYDTVTITMRMRSGILVTIHNSRNCAYGYDQRIEVFGSEGMIQSANQQGTSTVRYTDKATQIQPVYHGFFQDRYHDSYRIELEHFINCLAKNEKPSVNFDDGRAALIIANAAERSARSNMPEEIEY